MLSPKQLGFLQLLIGALIGLGGLIAYTEAKFAPKEGLLQEVKQRETDTTRIERKLDSIIEILINQRGK